MPTYSYVCECGHVFDEFHTSFGAAGRAEKDGITCPKCSTTRTGRNPDPGESMKGGAFRKYGLYTYS
jgi:predicted nucleic acid-binding Zn ribbon protein